MHTISTSRVNTTNPAELNEANIQQIYRWRINSYKLKNIRKSHLTMPVIQSSIAWHQLSNFVLD